jgi:hypothetical protein
MYDPGNSDVAKRRGQANLHREGRSQALSVLRACASEDGFLASPSDQANYKRIWGRDGSILALAALLSGEEELIAVGEATLRTLARHQGPHGEIPSNVDTASGRISYGGTAGRVDAGLWWTIAVGEVVKRRAHGRGFVEEMARPLDRCRWLFGAWEFNARGLLFVPPTGDWADEYVQSGYVLYDNLLYLQAQRAFAAFYRVQRNGGEDHRLDERIAHLGQLIRANYWFDGEAHDPPEDAYHPVLWRKGPEASVNCRGRHWMPFFSPLGYGTRFDGMAHGLVSLFGVSNGAQDAVVDEYLEASVTKPIGELGGRLLPAFDPVITPRDEYWSELQMSFSHTFKNEPYHYHNGGLWPLVTALSAAAAEQRGDHALALRYASGVHEANRAERDGQVWSFPEYLDGKRQRPGGTWPMGWSAAAAIIAGAYLDGERIFG